MTLNFEPGLSDRFPTLRAYVHHRSGVVQKLLKTQAADMDMGSSTLSRKLNPAEGDTQRFNVDDLEAWLASTGDAPAIIEYLASKFLDSDEARRARVLSRVEGLLPELAQLVSSLRSTS